MSAANWRVEVEPGTCIGSGICASLAPTVFAVGSDRVSRVVLSQVREDPVVVDAATCCPAQAIAVTDAATGRLVAPEE
jgi:ferredoxin